MSTILARLTTPGASLLREIRGEEGKLARLAIACFAGYVAWVLVVPHSPAHELIAELYNMVVPLAAALAAWGTARHPALDRRTRQAWLIFGFGPLAMAVGCAIWFVDDYVIGHRPAVSSADIWYLLCYPFFLLGLFRFPTARWSRHDITKLWLDVATVVVAGAAVIWYVILGPAVRAGTSTLLEIIVSGAYPIGDLVFIFASTVALLYRPAITSRRAIQLLLLSGVGLLGSDLTSGYYILHVGAYRVGTWTDLGWQSAMLFWVLAALHQRRQASSVATHDTQTTMDTSFEISAIPYVAMIVGYGLLAVVVRSSWNTPLGAVVIAVLVLTVVVIIRQLIAARENVHLLTDRIAAETRFRSLVQNSSDVITVVDEQNMIEFMSPAVERVFGWSPTDAIGTSITALVHRDDVDALLAFTAALQAELRAGRNTTAQIVLRCRNNAGEWRHVEAVATGMTDAGVGTQRLVFNTRDVSERMALQEKLTYQAYHDPLTGLANRAWFRTRVEQALTHAHTAPEHVAVFFLDLDNFKHINDSLGHSEGDHVLTEVSARLLNATRGSDTVARLGGDEFAVLVDRVTTEEDLNIIAKRITNAMRMPFALHNGEVFSSTSIGIARGSAAQSVDDLLRNADVAMYVSKRQGKGLYTIFESTMHADARRRLELETDLRHALLRDELTLMFQPIVDLETRCPIGVEALVRWHHPQRGLIGPDDFIPLAEESGLILPLGRWVLREACRHGARWSSLFPWETSFILSVNVSGTQLQQANFVEDVAAALRESGFPPHQLLLEITERVIVSNTSLTLQRLTALKALGVRLAIDDFGTGYSSLSFLQQFPIDVLKIDKSFVDNTTGTGSGPALAKTIVTLGETLSLQTVAEGVEYQQQADALISMGCDKAQGFYFSRPLPPAEIDILLRSPLTLGQTPIIVP